MARSSAWRVFIGGAAHLLAQRHSLDELVAEIEPAIVLADVEQRRDVRVRQRGRRPRIVYQTMLTLTDGEAWRSQLERDRAADLRVTRTVHLAEATLTNALEQVVMRNRADQLEDPFAFASLDLLFRP